jgi:predicted Zn finger-like uncharacterized protein
VTREHRFLVGLGDIRAVTLECKKCKARLSVSVDSVAGNGISQCPSCGHLWLSNTMVQKRYFMSPLSQLLASLAPSLLTEQDDGVGVRVLFEFDDAPR